MTGILGQLKRKRRKDNRLILLYKGLKGKASVPTIDLIPKIRRCRIQHSMAFQTPIANTDVYEGSFFPQTIRDWSALPDSLISSAEDAEDCVAKFTSLVRARDWFPNHRSWWVIVITAFHQKTILILILILSEQKFRNIMVCKRIIWLFKLFFYRLGSILWLDPLVERQNLGETRTIINKAYVHRELITNGFADENPNVSWLAL